MIVRVDTNEMVTKDAFGTLTIELIVKGEEELECGRFFFTEILIVVMQWLSFLVSIKQVQICEKCKSYYIVWDLYKVRKLYFTVTKLS